MIRREEIKRLDADHPEWKLLPNDEMHSQFWMYFRDDIAAARAEVYFRRLKIQVVVKLSPLVNWLNRTLSKVAK